MNSFFKDIFAYHHHFNQKLIDQLINHERILTERTVPLFSHLVNAHQIWNARITGKERLGVHELHTLQACKRIDDDNYHGTLYILATRQLDEQINYSNSKGVESCNTIQQILFHISNHFSHHKGQIIGDLRQIGIEPIVTDYIYYKR